MVRDLFHFASKESEPREVNVGIKTVPFLGFVERATWETFPLDTVFSSRKCVKHGMNPKILECP